MSKRRVNTLSQQLATEFPYIKKTKNESEVRCDKCLSQFSIASGGRRDITRHISSEKHKRMLSAAASGSTLTAFYRHTVFGDEEAKLAMSEALFSYHTVTHNHSFRSMDCTSKIIQKMFNNKFTCARTKAEAIIKKVLAPTALSDLAEDLEVVHYVSIFSDASNHKDVKLFPTLIRYFNVKLGVCLKILDFVSLPGETSELISNSIIDILNQNNLNSKLVAFCADNANTNFGGVARKGRQNVFQKLSDRLPQKIIGVGCAAHIVHNTIQTAADLLPVDIEGIINKIYSHFYIFTVRVESLKVFCEEVGVEYQKLLNSSKTRWLALMPAVEKVIKLYVPLKSYFLSLEKCPIVIQHFFNNETSELWLKFIHCQSSLFHETVKLIEGQKNTIVQVYREINTLIAKLNARLDDIFLPLIIRNDLTKLVEAGEVNRDWFVSQVAMFYKNCLDYLTLWSSQFLEVICLDWIELDKKIEWNAVQTSLSFISERFSQVTIDENALFDEITFLKKYICEEKIGQWSDQKITVDLRWVEVFNHFKQQHVPFKNVLQVVEFALCLPGTNAATERIFSIINNIWTTEKSQLTIETLKAMLLVRINMASSCEDFLTKIKGNTELLQKIHSAEKYM